VLTIGWRTVAALAAEYTAKWVSCGLPPGPEAQTRQRLDALPPEQFCRRGAFWRRPPRAEADRILVRLAPDAGAVEAAVVPPPAEQHNDLELILDAVGGL
jgi:hypothetical protein